MPRIVMALHKGWAIEGGIGSELKLDATYISPQIEITDKLAYLGEDDYKVPLLVSERVYSLLTPMAQDFLRKVDVITTNELKDPIGLFAFDANGETCEAPEGHNVGETVLLEEFAAEGIDACRAKGADYMFAVDADLGTLHSKAAQDIATQYGEALGLYVSGDWPAAAAALTQCLVSWPADGPSLSLKEYMEAYGNAAPVEWMGYRNVDASLPAPVFEEPEEVESKAEGKEEAKKEEKGLLSRKALVAIEEHDEEELASSVPGVKKKPAPRSNTVPPAAVANFPVPQLPQNNAVSGTTSPAPETAGPGSVPNLNLNLDSGQEILTPGAGSERLSLAMGPQDTSGNRASIPLLPSNPPH